MAVDASIPLSIQPVQLPNPLAMASQYAQLQAASQQSQLAGQQIQQGQRALDAQKTLSDLYSDPANLDPSTGQVNMQNVYQGLAKAGHADTALALAQKQTEIEKSRSEIGKNNADAGKLGADTANSQFDLHKKMVDTVASGSAALLSNPALSPDAIAQNPQAAYQEVNTFLASMADQGFITHDQAANASATLPPPQALRGFLLQKAQAALSAQQAIEANTPKLTPVALGNRTQLVDTNPNTNRGQPMALAHGESPDTAANIRKDYTIAGLNPDGTPSAGPDPSAELVAAGKAPFPTRDLNNPAGRVFIAKVLQANPDYDFTTVAARADAVKNFTTGDNANTIRSQATAIRHLGQLGELIDQVPSVGWQSANRVIQPFAKEFGNVDITNLEAAKEIVGREILKAITASGSGGSAGEAEDLKTALSGVKAPDQLRGVINTWTHALQAQKESFLTQRRQTTGLPDAAFPNYDQPPTPANSKVPASGAPAAGTVVPTKSEADYNALPSGAWYSKPGDPPGTHRVKN